MISSYPFFSLFLSTLTISTFMALSSNNWIMMWASMELNLLSMIPIISISSKNQETEASMKYFFAQAIGSALFLSAIIFSSSSSLFIISSETPFMLLILSIMIKAGAAPCHYWLPNVMSSLSWPLCLILTTWQKIIPIWFIIHITMFSSPTIILLAGILGAMVGGLGGMNQTQLRPIMAYSSINHTGWILSCSVVSTYLSLIYFIAYALSLIPIMIMFSNLNIKTTPQTNSLSNLSHNNKMWIMLFFLSLGGLPPLFGFMPKMIVILSLINNNLILISLALILGSILSLYYYLTIFFNLALGTSMNSSLHTPLLPFNSQYSIFLLSTLIFMPLIISLFYALIILH